MALGGRGGVRGRGGGRSSGKWHTLRPLAVRLMGRSSLSVVSRCRALPPDDASSTLLSS